jgi:undecaprenyl diphosphate synthase
MHAMGEHGADEGRTGAGPHSLAHTAPHLLPRHVAIIMDGNNRWARQRNLPGPAGHRAGVEAVRGVMRACRDHKIEVLTLFAFSSENWQRPLPEVRALLALLSRYLRTEVKQLTTTTCACVSSASATASARDCSG